MSTRREFLKAGGAVTVLISLPAYSQSSDASGSVIGSNRLTVHANGQVELFLGKVEFGQGIGTAMAQIAAEELDVSLDRIALRGVDTDRSPDEFFTFSSISVQQSGPPTRRAAAAVRTHLLESAAAELGQAATALSVRDGEILANGNTTGLSYWDLIGDTAVELAVSNGQATKRVEDYETVGRSVERLDIPGKVFGAESYLQDMRLPDMLHARIVRPNFERGSLDDIDLETAAGLPGVVEVLRDGNFVAVLAEREGQARRAAQEIAGSVVWKNPEDIPDPDTFFEHMKAAEARTETILSADDADEIKGEVVARQYRKPFLAHASMAPSAAVAHYDGERLTVWSHAQGMYPLKRGIAHVMGLEEDQVRCIHKEASGGYGHNGADDAAYDAAAIAMRVPGRPIRLQWERKDEMAWEPYGSAMNIEIEAELDDDATIRRWNYDLWSYPHTSRPRDPINAANMIYPLQREAAMDLPPVQTIAQPNGGADRNSVPYYAFDATTVRKHLLTDVPMRVSALRGLGAFGNIFAIESFMDELAAEAGVDPIEYRLRHLDDARAAEVLERLAAISNWENRPKSGDGEGWGIGFARYKNTGAWFAVLAQVSIDDGDIRIDRAVATCDAGLIINPDGAIAQLEGGIVQSSSWALKEQVRFDQRGKRSLDWASYPIFRFDEVPHVEVELINRPDEPPLGVAEAAQGPTAAAIANAVFHATGQRIRQLPLRLA